MNFINPPPFDDEGDSPTYHLNSVIMVRWTEGEEGTATSLTLWQLNSTTRAFFGDIEYITNNVLDRNNFRWIVATSKNLTVSNLFFLSIFEEGKTASDANSLPFIIEAAKDDDNKSKDEQEDTSTLINSTISTTTSTPTGTQTGTQTGTSSSATTDSTTTDIPSEDGNGTGLSTAGKIAIGTVIPLVIILAIAGFFLLKWRRKGRGAESQSAAVSMAAAHGPLFDPEDTGYKMNLETHHWQSHPPPEEFRRWERIELPGSETRQTTMVYELETSPQRV